MVTRLFKEFAESKSKNTDGILERKFQIMFCRKKKFKINERKTKKKGTKCVTTKEKGNRGGKRTTVVNKQKLGCAFTSSLPYIRAAQLTLIYYAATLNKTNYVLLQNYTVAAFSAAG